MGPPHSRLIVRKFAYVGDQGALVWQEGVLTPEEQQLGLNYTAQSLEEGSVPDEDNVTALAALWSIDPSTLEEQELPKSVGLLGTLP